MVFDTSIASLVVLTWNPSVWSWLLAEPSAAPVTSGTVTWAGPEDTNSVTAVPTGGDQTAINSALQARAQTAIFLTVASPEYTAQH